MTVEYILYFPAAEYGYSPTGAPPHCTCARALERAAAQARTCYPTERTTIEGRVTNKCCLTLAAVITISLSNFVFKVRLIPLGFSFQKQKIPVIELTTWRLSVRSHNHYTKEPTVSGRQ